MSQPCELREDYQALAEVVHGIAGDHRMLKTWMDNVERRLKEIEVHCRRKLAAQRREIKGLKKTIIRIEDD